MQQAQQKFQFRVKYKLKEDQKVQLFKICEEYENKTETTKLVDQRVEKQVCANSQEKLEQIFCDVEGLKNLIQYQYQKSYNIKIEFTLNPNDVYEPVPASFNISTKKLLTIFEPSLIQFVEKYTLDIGGMDDEVYNHLSFKIRVRKSLDTSTNTQQPTMLPCQYLLTKFDILCTNVIIISGQYFIDLGSNFYYNKQGLLQVINENALQSLKLNSQNNTGDKFLQYTAMYCNQLHYILLTKVSTKDFVLYEMVQGLHYIDIEYIQLSINKRQQQKRSLKSMKNRNRASLVSLISDYNDFSSMDNFNQQLFEIFRHCCFCQIYIKNIEDLLDYVFIIGKNGGDKILVLNIDGISMNSQKVYAQIKIDNYRIYNTYQQVYKQIYNYSHEKNHNQTENETPEKYENHHNFILYFAENLPKIHKNVQYDMFNTLYLNVHQVEFRILHIIVVMYEILNQDDQFSQMRDKVLSIEVEYPFIKIQDRTYNQLFNLQQYRNNMKINETLCVLVRGLRNLSYVDMFHNGEISKYIEHIFVTLFKKYLSHDEIVELNKKYALITSIKQRDMIAREIQKGAYILHYDRSKDYCFSETQDSVGSIVQFLFRQLML